MRLFLLVLAAMIAVPAAAQAEPLQVRTGQDVYAYGDFLSFTVTVPAVTQETATFRIIDEAGMGSSRLAMSITGESTVLTAPNPFTSVQYGVGIYTVTVEYDGDAASASFELVDSGRVIIPFWIKDVSALWADGMISDAAFFKNLTDNGIITSNQPLTDDADVTIPAWYRSNAQWWMDGRISDDEFAGGLQYLINVSAVSIGR